MALEQFEQHSEPTSLAVTQIERRLGDLPTYANLRAALDLTLQSLIDNQLLENASPADAGADELT